jgi:nicotinate dehydrogenase subunit A
VTAPLTLTVNGISHELVLPPGTLLIDALRTDLALKGTRHGCGEGACGACTVLVNGIAVQSCDIAAAECAGAVIETIESEAAAPVAAAFMEFTAAQCGYCTAGIVMTIVGWLRNRPMPDRAELIAKLDERNLCRCGAHARILRVVDTLLARVAS